MATHFERAAGVHSSGRAGVAAEPVRVLLVADAADAAGLLEYALAGKAADAIALTRARTIAEGCSLFDRGHHDLVLLHAGFGEAAVCAATETILRLQSSAAIVVLSDGLDESPALTALDHGAMDVLAVSELDGPPLERLLRYARARRAAMHESEQRLRTMTDHLVDSMPGAFLLLDASWRIRRSNTAVQQALGWESTELDGRSLDELLRPDDLTRLTAGLSEAAEHGILSIELQLARKSGGFAPFYCTGAPFWHEGERCLLVTGMDLSERRNMETQLAHAQKMDSIGRLAGGVAHDFNNMLAAVLSFSELVLMDSAPDDPRRRDVETIRDTAIRATELSRQLLTFSRRQTFTPRTTSINTLISGIDRMLRRLIGADVELVTLLGEGLRHVEVDPGQLESALMNLVVNARDAMPEGGTLTIETSAASLLPSRAHAGDGPPLSGPVVRITITDTGTGMSEDVLQRIFEPFFTTKAAGKGTGLGMSLVYGIVKQSGGEIGVSSKVGKGTRFTIDLPASASALDAEGDHAREPAPGGTETVLVAEDNDLLRSGVAASLGARGYTVLTAASGPEALRLAASHPGPIDLLLSDVVMPLMSARELRQRMREVRPDTRMIFMSGYLESPSARADLAGHRFLQKPFLCDDLLRLVRETLEEDS